MRLDDLRWVSSVQGFDDARGLESSDPLCFCYLTVRSNKSFANRNAFAFVDVVAYHGTSFSSSSGCLDVLAGELKRPSSSILTSSNCALTQRLATICCCSHKAQKPSIRITPDQQQRLREAYSPPMRPSQCTRGTEDSVDKERADADKEKSEKETPRQAAVRREHERVSMEKVLLDRRWVFHCTSPLFHFHRDKLSAYAHDLVKTLRAAVLRACGQQFGYSVNIRTTDTFVAFQTREEREQRCSRAAKTGASAPEREASERSGGFVLYFPTEEEEQVPKGGRERQQVLLLRGDEELLRWVCSWLQRSFQCVVSTHVVHIQQMNLKRLARNWAVASLLAEGERLSRARRDMKNQEEELSRGSFKAAQEPLRAPLLLKYRATKAADVVRTYTLTVPWATLRRLFQQTKDGPGGNRPSTYVPELIEMTERLYVDALPFDLSTYEIERIELQEVAIDLDGGVELYSMDLVHTVLFSLLELLAIQDVKTASRLETTL